MKISNNLRKIIILNIDRMIQSGAEYSDVRFHEDDNSETIFLNDGNLEANDTTFESGIGIRVLFGGAWGFAATSNFTDIQSCFNMAFKNAETASKLML